MVVSAGDVHLEPVRGLHLTPGSDPEKADLVLMDGADLAKGPQVVDVELRTPDELMAVRGDLERPVVDVFRAGSKVQAGVSPVCGQSKGWNRLCSLESQCTLNCFTCLL